MGERKVVNKYFPPGFDPKRIPRRKQLKNQQMTVRMMLPMSIRCATCGNYMYKGTKFNSRKEDVIQETYLGIKIFRFYFKCVKCSAEITYRTDPKNSDYTVESGATRNFEPWRAEDEEMEKKKQRKDGEIGESMKSLENRTLNSKRENDIDATLDELKSLKARQANESVDAMLEANVQRRLDVKKLEELEDESLVKSMFFQGSRNPIVKRIRDEELEEEINDDDDDLVFNILENNSLRRRKFFEEKPTDLLAKARISDRCNNRDKASSSSIVKLSVVNKPKQEQEKHTSNGLLSLCQQYESDEDI